MLGVAEHFVANSAGMTNSFSQVVKVFVLAVAEIADELQVSTVAESWVDRNV